MAKAKTAKPAARPRSAHGVTLHFAKGDSLYLTARIIPGWKEQIGQLLAAREQEDRPLTHAEAEIIAQAVSNKIQLIAGLLVPLAGCGQADPDEAAMKVEILVDCE